MIEGLIGQKIGMTQVYDKEGNVIPVTILKVGPCAVIQKKTKDKDGYDAVQLGFLEDKPVKRPNRPTKGHFRKSGLSPCRIIREFRLSPGLEVKEGDRFFVDIFKEGEKVRVTGTTKGKGFQGVVKRWGFHGGPASHGSMFHRRPGSIGASSFPSHVWKGMRMGGHMGQDKLTIRNLLVVKVDRENNLLLVKGAVPGPRGGYVLVRKNGFARIKT
ncbi:MAG: 50S ribosomal protein L3 [Candidatus Aminicenantes bacterium]|nr:50S ribosomal protein L3 [Candidatus Aminicenantes bacterium]